MARRRLFEFNSREEGWRVLWVEVIRRALEDLHRGPEEARADARRFLQGEGLEYACSWLDLDPKWLRQRLAEEGILDLAA